MSAEPQLITRSVLHAKIAYETWQHRAGRPDHTAFEMLPPREFQAWCEAAEAIRDLIEDELPRPQEIIELEGQLEEMEEEQTRLQSDFEAILDALCTAVEPAYIYRLCAEHGWPWVPGPKRGKA